MHEHIFQLDCDGQVTCSLCGARDDEMMLPSQEEDYESKIAPKDPYAGLDSPLEFE